MNRLLRRRVALGLVVLLAVLGLPQAMGSMCCEQHRGEVVAPAAKKSCCDKHGGEREKPSQEPCERHGACLEICCTTGFPAAAAAESWRVVPQHTKLALVALVQNLIASDRFGRVEVSPRAGPPRSHSPLRLHLRNCVLIR